MTRDSHLSPPDLGTVPGMAVAVVAPGAPVQVEVVGLADAVTGRPLAATTPMHACSMAKLVTAVGVLRLVAAGALGLDDDVRAFVPLDGVPRGSVPPTVRHLLAHRAGICDPPGSFEPTVAPAPDVADVLEGRTSAHPGQVAVTGAPGEGFAYSDAGYCVLERIVEVVVGETFADALHRLVVAPLGLVATTFWTGEEPPSGPRGAVVSTVAGYGAAGHHTDGSRVEGGRVHYAGAAASGLWTTPADLGTVLADLARSWSGGDGVLLPAALAAQMLDDSVEPGVGLGVFLGSTPEQPIVWTQGWGVGFQSQARVYPRAGGAVAVLVDADPGVPQARSVVGATVERVAAERGWTVRGG